MSFDSYFDAGVFVSAELVNELVVAEKPPPLSALRQVFAIDLPSVRALKTSHLPALRDLAGQLGEVFALVDQNDVDAAANTLNGLLSRYPAHPHLAKEDGTWRLHHHPADVSLVSMWAAICAEALARVIGTGNHERLGTCSATNCRRVFVDESKNLSRRYCSSACQNRTKAEAFRRRLKR